MKLIMLAIAMAACAAGPLQEYHQPKVRETITDVTGTVQKVANLGWGLVPDDRKGERYQPFGMPEEFLVDGLRVRFSGDVFELEPNIRRWGTPLRITKVERLEE